MSLFLDTSALYAVLDRDDASHREAKKTWRRLLEAFEPMVTTSYVLVETAALVQHRLGVEALRILFDDVVPVLDVEWIGRADHETAVSALLAAGRRKLSLVDCCSFQMMRRLGLRRAFAFDSDFDEQGFEIVR